MNSVIMHINYAEGECNSFGKRTIDDICRMASEIGFNGIEFRGMLPPEFQGLSFREYAAQIATGKKKHELSDILFGIDVAECTNADKAVREKAITDAIEKAKIARELCGTTVCNTFGSWITSEIPGAINLGYEFHGSAAATKKDWDLTIDSFGQIGNALEKIDVKFALETHMGYLHDTPEAAKKLVELIGSPAIGINLDFGNTVYFPVHPSIEETIESCGDKIFYTHLKNSLSIPGSRERMPTALSEGEINHRIYLSKLQDVAFSGPIGIEAPRPGDREWFAKCDFEYFKAVRNDTGF